MYKIFIKAAYYVIRIVLFLYICLKVLIVGILRPNIIFNFLFGVVTEVAEFHKRCGGPVLDFKDSTIFQEMVRKVEFSRSNCFNAGFGSIRPLEAQILAGLVAHFKPEVVFEIGTFNGFSTLHLAKNVGEDVPVYTLDLPDNRGDIVLKNDWTEAHKDIKNMDAESVRLFRADPKVKNIVELYGDSASFDFSPWWGRVDFVFIDANHSYEYVKKDSENAFKMISDRGVIVWHDFDFIHPGVYKFIKQLAKSRTIYFVERSRFAIFVNTQKTAPS